MNVVVWLPHRVSAFAAQAGQVERLAAQFPAHGFKLVVAEPEFLAELAGAEVALVWQFEAEWYRRAPQLKWVGTPAAGREKVKPDPSGRVRSVHGHFHGKIMGETLLGAMLHFSRGLDLCVEFQRARNYARDVFLGTRRLSGQHAVIAGYGPLGRECARLLKAFGMRVTGLKRSPRGDPAPADELRSVTELHALLPELDHLILTLPSDTGTDHFIGEAELALMKPSACLYNIGRGNAVDEAALIRALENGRLGHAFLDVFAEEPLPQSSPLWQAPRLLLMPHASAISQEYLDLWFQELAAEQF
jgi:phosphoglycerate dehydrogenase-like enzyme